MKLCIASFRLRRSQYFISLCVAALREWQPLKVEPPSQISQIRCSPFGPEMVSEFRAPFYSRCWECAFNGRILVEAQGSAFCPRQELPRCSQHLPTEFG